MKIRYSNRIDSKIEFVKNLLAFITGRTITFQEYINMECREIYGEENTWYAGEKLKRTPTHIDCHKHYIMNEADKLFHKKHYYLVERPWQKKLKNYMHHISESLQNFRYSIQGR